MGFGFPHIPNPIDIVTDVVKDKVVDPIKDNVIDPTVGAVEDAGSWTKNNVIDPAVGGIEDAGSWTKNNVLDPAVGGIEDAGSWIKDNAIDPVVGGVEDAGSWIKKKWTDAAELAGGYDKPTYQKQPDLSKPDAGSKIAVTPEELTALSRAAQGVSDDLNSSPGQVEGCADGVAGQLHGWDTAGAVADCCHAWGTALRKVAGDIHGIADTLQKNAASYSAADQNVAGSLPKPR
ncbi:WXG100 family type VII secretion target [Yinghuangia seranimata]|uniref:WXG100 family type VII secretion target n=1 Tax=Yinghuangia seranimata TaxID=408067 RepID=UPI00248B1292|nr:type VII secretion target [Yinghuangia seranimata]MDI2129339.1 type VII secretion target [Yinghuangia seranimata]